MYAFSIENFRRSEDEVNALLQLAKEKFEVDTCKLALIKTKQTKLQALVGEADKLAKHGVRVRILGDTSLLPAVSVRPLEYSLDNIAGCPGCYNKGGGGDSEQL